MFLTDQPTAVSALPTPSTPGTPGYFTNGNPGGAQPATILDADFMNMLMMELANVVTGAGLVLSKTTYNQLQSAIKRIGQNTVVLADTGAVNAYTAVNTVPLVAGGSPTWVDGVVQAVKIAHTNTGPSTYAPDGLTPIPIYGLGLQALQNGELIAGGTAILMHATIAGVNSGNPICVLMECPGGAQQIPSATQSLHAVNLGQFPVSLTGNGYVKLPNGVIIQWGATGPSSSSSSVTVPFPIAFPNGVYQVMLGAVAISNAADIATLDGSSSSTGFPYSVWSITNTRVAGLGSSFIAIGH